MKYSENLPKIDYTTTIGTFKVVDVSSYFELNQESLETDTLQVSNDSTLVEMSSTVYADTDSLWLFLYANEAVNPFMLLKNETTTKINEYNTNVTVNSLQNDSTESIIPAGSIIFPYVDNGGSAWEYGSTGNFSLTGGFALVQSSNSFTKSYTTIQPYGGMTLTVGDIYIALLSGTTYTYMVDSTGTPTNFPSKVISQADSTKIIKYKNPTNLEVYAQLDDDGPVTAKGGNDFLPTGITQSISFTEAERQEPKEIKYYLPYSVGYLNLTRVVQNYSV